MNAIAAGCVALGQSEPVFARLLADYGQPPLWRRAASLRTLVHIILEQKVSLESARAVLERVEQLCPGMTPATLLAVPETALLEAGVSRMKASYCHSIAAALQSGELDLARLENLGMEAAQAQLTAVRGIGPWSAGVYIMMVVCHPNAWAPGDRALAVSVQECFELPEVPGYAELDRIAEAWQPYRGSAARLLWNGYLHKRNRVDNSPAACGPAP